MSHELAVALHGLPINRDIPPVHQRIIKTIPVEPSFFESLRRRVMRWKYGEKTPYGLAEWELAKTGNREALAAIRNFNQVTFPNQPIKEWE